MDRGLVRPDFDSLGAEGTPLDRHGNPNVLTHDLRTSSLSQSPAAHSARIDVRVWPDDETPPAVRAFEPPDFHHTEVEHPGRAAGAGDPMNTIAGEVVAQLAQRGVRVVFGIPGVHTLELYRGLARQESGTSPPGTSKAQASWPMATRARPVSRAWRW